MGNPGEIVQDGEFAGWIHWPMDRFETQSGPFFHRIDDTGEVQCAFRTEAKHISEQGIVHGGCFLVFADCAIFALTRRELGQYYGVTATLDTQFLGSAVEGELVEARGEIVKAGGSLIFVRGLVKTGDRPLLSFSASIKRLKTKRND